MTEGGGVEAFLSVALLTVLSAVVACCSSYECSAKANASGIESEWGPVKGCMVKVKGRWVPYDRWRAVDE